MKRVGLVFLISAVSLFSDELIDLEENTHDFVLETKRLEIPGFPTAFNPSIVSWRGAYLLSFRVIPNRFQSFTSQLGVVLLDENFSPLMEPQLLNLRENDCPIPSRAEDGRLLYVGDKLYFVYSDNEEEKISKGGFRLYVAELEFDGIHFILKNRECLSRYEGESRNIREKNWGPFDFRGTLLLEYSLMPHLIFRPMLDGSNGCETVASTLPALRWDWGILRGGTSAIQGVAENGDYLAFFHSSKKMASVHSDGKNILHYFMGAYTFSPDMPFSITRISPEPIRGQGFYQGEYYKPFWHPVRVVFPGGYVFDEPFIWLVYGRQDHEVWVVKLDRKKLLESLVPVDSETMRP